MIFAAGPAASQAAADAALKPFADVFPAANIHHHFVGQDQAKGVYAKELHIPAGFRMVSHAHPYDHISILASGVITLQVGDQSQQMIGPRALTIKAREHHTLFAHTDAVWFCIHPTDETDAAKVDDAILKPD